MVVIAVFMAATSLLADTETVGSYTWTYSINGDTAEIFNEYNAAISPSPVGAVTIPATLGGKPVTSIGDWAFGHRSGLTSVTIPDGVTSIGGYAFSGCSGLTNLTIPDGVTSIGDSAFYNCSGLTSVTIPDGVTNIGNNAFSYCSGLTSVNIPDSVTSIGHEAFAGCDGLTNISVEVANVAYKSVNGMLLTKDGKTLVVGVNGDVTIPDGVTSIGFGAFYGCSGLTSVTIPDGVTSIGNYAFYNCSGLTSVTIPGSVTSIGSSAFAGCDGLTSMTIGDGVTSIGDGAFAGCDGLTSVTIPDSVTSIGGGAFSHCSGLTSVTIPDSVTSIGGGTFSHCNGLADANGFIVIRDVLYSYVGTADEATIPENVTTIGSYAFEVCRGLTTVTIPDSVTSIGEGAFSDCSGLTSVTIPDSVASIGWGAFRGCSGLADANGFVVIRGVLYSYVGSADEVTIPENVTTIGPYAFSGCSGLTTVMIPDGVTSIDLGSFVGCAEGLYDKSSIPGVVLVDGWAIGHDGNLSGGLDLTGVRGIAREAFSGCSGLTSVTIPDGVTSIGDWAFSWCGGLTSVTIPNSVTNIGDGTFLGCNGLTSVTIPDSVTRIEDYAFYECWRLANVRFMGNAPTIGVNTFSSVSYSCTAYVPRTSTGWGVEIPGKWNGISIAYYVLPEFTIVDGVLTGVELNGATEVVIPDGVTSIGDSAFESCSRLASVTIPDSVTHIGNRAFAFCYNLVNVVMSESITNIGSEAFAYCDSLTRVAIPANVNAIGKEAFRNCYSLNSFTVASDNLSYTSVAGLLLTKDGKTLVAVPGGLASVTISDDVTSIGDYAFYGCSSLVNLTIPSGVTNIGYEAFCDCDELISFEVLPENQTYKSESGLLLSRDGKTLVAAPGGLESVVIPEGVKIIGVAAFSGGHLVNVTIPYGVTNIGDDAFRWTSVESVTIPCGVTNIGKYAFWECYSLTNVTIPDSVVSIGYKAFGDDRRLYDTNSITGVLIVDGWAIDNTSFLSGSLDLSGVRGIGDGAFRYCYNLTDVTMGNCVTSIGNYAFEGCSGLTSVTIPYGVTSIGDSAFSSCSSLACVTIPDGVTSIGERAFYGCSGLTSVTIPDSVTSIGEGAFSGCSGLEEITLPFVGSQRGDSGTPESLFGYIFGSSSYTGGTQTRQYYSSSSYTSYTSYYIPSNLKRVVVTDETVLGYGVFYNCSGLAGVTIPDSVTSIVRNAFNGCTNLRNVTVSQYVCGRSLRSVFPSAYQSITNVVISDNVNTISSGAFIGCGGLTGITVGEGNAYYKSIDGLLLTNDGRTLVRGVNGDVTIPDGVTSIGEGAFYGCSGLTSVTIPDGVTSIGVLAFYNCSGLTSVTIPNSVTNIGEDAFSGCSGLTGLTIPDSVSEIEKGAFSGCSGLTSVTIPNSVTSIGYGAFYNCSGLTSVTIPNSVTNIGELAFSGCSGLANVDGFVIIRDVLYSYVGTAAEVTIPVGVTSIGASAFYDCIWLTSVTIPDGVQGIGDYAFCNCCGLTNVLISVGVKFIREGAFEGCSSLTSVTIPDSVTSIGMYAFCDCSGLTSVSIGSGVMSIWEWAFEGCNDLLFDRSTIPGVVMVDGWAIGNDGSLSGELDLTGIRGIGANAFCECSELTSVMIPDGVTRIGPYAFEGCGGLTSATIPNSVTGIGDGAFECCSGLTTVTIPDGVTSIGGYAFYGCSGLTSVTIPDNVTTLDFATFYGCTGLTNVVIGCGLASIWTDEGAAFGHCSGLEEMTVDDRNEYFSSTNGLLLSKDGKSLFVGINGDVTIPDGVTRIMSQAFSDCKSLTSVIIPDSVTDIEWYAFYGCDNLTNVVFGGAVPLGLDESRILSSATGVWYPKQYADEYAAIVPEEKFAGYACDGLDWLVNDVGRYFWLGGDAEWFGVYNVSHDGEGAIRSGEVGAADEGGRTNSTLTATVFGEGSGSFWWKVHCEEMDEEYGEWYDYAVFSIDGTEVAKIAGDSGWQQVEYTVTGTGPHTLTWTFTRDDYDEEDADWANAAWVDEFVWTPTPVTVSFADGGATGGAAPDAVTKYEGYELALPGAGTLAKEGHVFVGWSDGATTWAAGDVYVLGFSNVTLTAVWRQPTLAEAAGLTVTTGGDAEWIVDTTTWTDDVSARSGAVTNGQSSWIETQVSGAGTLSFRWNVEGGIHRNTPFAYATVVVDGEQQGQEHLTDGWKSQELTIEGAGTHTIRWTYQRTSARPVAEGKRDCAWLNTVTWTPNAPEELIPVVADGAAAEAVTNAIEAAGFADEAGVKAAIGGNATEYRKFKEWAQGVKVPVGGDGGGAVATQAGEAAVVANTNAAAAYLLGAERLFENAPKVEFGELVVVENGTQGTGGTGTAISVAVTVKDGEEAVKCVAEKVAAMFEATSDLGDWNGAAKIAPTVTVEDGEGATMRFKVTPGDGAAPQAFLRIRK